MAPNEKIYVSWFSCMTAEDDYEHGESLEVSSEWDDRDIGFDKTVPYDTPEAALKAVYSAIWPGCACTSTDWMNFGVECSDDPEDLSRFDIDVLVDKDNADATFKMIDLWKRRKLRLYNCHVIVKLEVRTLPRPLTADEISEWTIDRSENSPAATA